MFLRKFLSQKGLAGAKVLLFNSSNLLNFQRPIGSFLKPNILSSLVLSDLVYSTIKSLSILIYYIWEWVLMISGILITLFSIYIYFFPFSLGFLTSSFPTIELYLDVLGIEHEPITWYNYISDSFNYIYDSMNYIFNKSINSIKYLLTVNIYVYKLNLYLFNLFIYSPYIIIINSWKWFKSICAFSSISFLLYFISKCWILFDNITNSALDFMEWGIQAPRLWYYLVSSVDHILIQPFHNVARNSNTFFEVLNNLIPSERDLVQHIINITNLSNYIIETQCINALMEIINSDNFLFKFSLRILFFPIFCYFKVTSLGFKSLSSWLTGWL